MELDEEMEEAMTATKDGNMIADENGWGKFASRQKHFDFTGEKGVKGDIPPTITALELFSLFIDDEVIDLIVTNTNIYAEELKLRKEDQKYAPIQRWTPTNREEIRKFLILTVWMGLVPIGNLKDYWATQSIIYKFEYPQSIMSRNRYQVLLSVIHFNNNSEMERGNRLAKIRPLKNILQAKFQSLYTPSEEFVIDESLVPWRGRLIFRQYIPNKAHRYGVKLFKLCATNGYTWSFRIYAGKASTVITCYY